MNSHVKKLLKEREVAECLGVSVRTLQHWRLVGEGPTYTKIGRCVRYEASEVSDFIQFRRCVSTNDTTSLAYNGKSYS